MSGIKLSNARKFAISGAAAVAVALPLAMVSAPAQAATTLNGCTVDPIRPAVVGQVGGVPQVRFATRVTCVGGPDRADPGPTARGRCAGRYRW